jgi:hypothetical protein
MPTSSHADAPRGMEFLYSANRLNVATWRAQCLCIVVASLRLFEAECRTPRQMQLASAFCRYWSWGAWPTGHFGAYWPPQGRHGVLSSVQVRAGRQTTFGRADKGRTVVPVLCQLTQPFLLCSG